VPNPLSQTFISTKPSYLACIIPPILWFVKPFCPINTLQKSPENVGKPQKKYRKVWIIFKNQEKIKKRFGMFYTM
jgi:hypothetical protein